MNTCDTCKWWSDEEFVDRGIPFRSCECLMVCRPTYGESYARKTPCMDGVLTADEGGGTDLLMTAPKFGCIHHMKKDA